MKYLSIILTKHDEDLYREIRKSYRWDLIKVQSIYVNKKTSTMETIKAL
jgi:hypothetical protein